MRNIEIYESDFDESFSRKQGGGGSDDFCYDYYELNFDGFHSYYEPFIDKIDSARMSVRTRKRLLLNGE
jgi:hypothetical protein